MKTNIKELTLWKVNKARKLRKQGMPVTAIARHLNLSTARIYEYLSDKYYPYPEDENIDYNEKSKRDSLKIIFWAIIGLLMLFGIIILTLK